MKTLEFFLIRNKETGNYVYEEVDLVHDTVKLKETDNIHFLTSSYRLYSDNKLNAESRAKRFEKYYVASLEVVKFEKHVEYKEVL